MTAVSAGRAGTAVMPALRSGPPARSAWTVAKRAPSSDPGHEERESAQLKLLGEPDENAFGPAHVAQPVCVLVLDDVLADQLRTSLRQPFDGVVDVVNREHHSQVAESVDRRVAVIGDNLRREKPRQFKPAMAVRRAHHGDLDPLVAQSRDASGPLAFNQTLTFEL